MDWELLWSVVGQVLGWSFGAVVMIAIAAVAAGLASVISFLATTFIVWVWAEGME